MLRTARGKALALGLLAALGLAISWTARRGSTREATGAAREDPAQPTEARPGFNRALPSLAADVAAEAGPPAPAVAAVAAVAPSHAVGPTCVSCSAKNCAPATDGCDQIASPADRQLCEEIYACFTDPANACTGQGDAIRCWCGTNPTTCVSAESGPLAANGPCAKKVLAGARTTNPETIRERFLDPSFPLGRAANLTACRGAFCSSECKLP